MKKTGAIFLLDEFNPHFSPRFLHVLSFFLIHRIGLREILQETPIFHGTNHGFRLRFSLKPIQRLVQLTYMWKILGKTHGFFTSMLVYPRVAPHFSQGITSFPGRQGTSPGSPRMLCCRTLKTVQYVDASVLHMANEEIISICDVYIYIYTYI